MDSVTGAVFGREQLLTAISESITGGTGPRVIVLAGQAGIGRSTVLTAARDRLDANGTSTVLLRVTRNDHGRPNALAARLAGELGAHDADTRRGNEGFAAVARRHAATIAARGPLAVFVDDAQWMDPASLTALAGLAHTLSGTRITVLCAVRTPTLAADAQRAVLAGLRSAGLVTVLPLRPLHAGEVDAMVTARMQARPSTGLSEELRRTCRGVPAAVLAALDGHQATDSLRVVDRHVYLVEPGRPVEVATDLPMFERLRRLGEPAFSVVKALAVLHPLGATAVELIAGELGTSVEAVGTELARLAAEGVLRPAADGWRFRLPVLAQSLPACLGPYERRRLAQLAVTAVWDGRADPGTRYLADQLVVAGRLVDAQRASSELLGTAAAHLLDDGYHADRWLRGALELITDPGQRVGALFLLAAVSGLHMRFPGAVESAGELLNGPADALPPETMFEVAMIYLVGLTGTLDRDTRRELAESTWRSMPGSDGHRLVLRAATLGHLDRWQEGYRLLTDGREIWQQDNDAVAAFGLTLTSASAAFLGHTAEFDSYVADPTQGKLWNVDRHRVAHLAAMSRTLLVFGELDRSRTLLEDYEVPLEQQPAPDVAVAAMLAGDWDRALDLARVSLATGSSLGYSPVHAEMCRATATILTARGRLAQARAVLGEASTTGPALGYLLAAPEAALERIQGDPRRAEELLRAAMTKAGADGLLVGTEESWLALLELRLAAGDRADAQRCHAELARIAGMLGTGRARLYLLVADALIGAGGTNAAADAVALARERDQPYELAGTLATLAGHGALPASTLLEAYELYGELDALLSRSRLRAVLRAHNVPVPGRSGSLAEHERLLGSLVADGLTNRELAVAIGDSEKSVEGRLSRLLQRTGFRSRVELATAILTGVNPAA